MTCFAMIVATVRADLGRTQRENGSKALARFVTERRVRSAE